MKKILLLSDTHGYLDERILSHVDHADEVWHAGDIGNPEVFDVLAQRKPLRAVYGNIDGHSIRAQAPELLCFDCEGLKVLMTHIAGYPGRYNAQARAWIAQHKPQLVVCGHSHILKVMQDKKNNHLHMNPGAAGISGFHKIRTMLRFEINKGGIENFVAIELGLRGALSNAIHGAD